jgi:hypothetical protein
VSSSQLWVKDLRESGLLWLINRVVFHPRGFALGMAYRDDGEFIGWALQGDGSEPWRFDGDEDDLFRRVEETFAEATRLATGETCQPGQPFACGDYHNAGHCVRPSEHREAL